MAKQSIIIGIPKEIKNNENRVALTPGGASSLILAGHQVISLGVNTYKGKVTYQAVAEAVNLPFAQLSDLLPK